MASSLMKLSVYTPEQKLIEVEADKVIAESPEGFFCLKPRHVDMLTVLTAGILYYYKDGKEEFVAVGEGVLVKWGNKVDVSVLRGIQGTDLEKLSRLVSEEFKGQHIIESETKDYFRHLEARLIQHYITLESGEEKLL